MKGWLLHSPPNIDWLPIMYKLQAFSFSGTWWSFFGCFLLRRFTLLRISKSTTLASSEVQKSKLLRTMSSKGCLESAQRLISGTNQTIWVQIDFHCTVQKTETMYEVSTERVIYFQNEKFIMLNTYYTSVAPIEKALSSPGHSRDNHHDRAMSQRCRGAIVTHCDDRSTFLGRQEKTMSLHKRNSTNF